MRANRPAPLSAMYYTVNSNLPDQELALENYGYLSAMRKYVQFGGRAPRKEYWMFVLVYMIGVVLLSVVDGQLFGYTTQVATEGIGGSVSVEYPVFSGLFMLAHLLPGLAVTIRRLHDIGRSGWWFLIVLVPLIGPLVMLYWSVNSSEPADNQYGPHPYGAIDPDIFGRAGAGDT